MNQENSVINHIRVVGISGSLRNTSYSRMAVKIALRGAEKLGAQTQLIDLRDYDLAFCNGREDESAYPEDVVRLRRDVQWAHGIVLGTPEYHGSFSGVLKNAIDLMGFAEFEGKMIGLVGVSGGRMGAINALNGLRTVGRALRAWVIPEQVSIPAAWQMFDKAGNLKHGEVEERLEKVGQQVARFAHLHRSEQAMEFLKAWEVASVNPGGGNV